MLSRIRAATAACCHPTEDAARGDELGPKLGRRVGQVEAALEEALRAHSSAAAVGGDDDVNDDDAAADLLPSSLE